MSLLKNIAPFSSLRTEILGILDRQIRVRPYPKGVVIYCEDDVATGMFIVVQGSVKTYTANNKGRKLILRECAVGDSFGVIEMLSGTTRLCSAITREDSLIAAINEGDFRSMLAKAPEIWKSLAIGLARDFKPLTWHLKNLALFDVNGRVKNLLKAASTESDGQLIVNQRLTQQDIADRIGATRERVSFVLSELRKAGVLSERDGRFVLAENAGENGVERESG